MATHTINIINPCEQRISVTVDKKTVKRTTRAVAAKHAQHIKHGGFRQQSPITQARALNQLTPEDKIAIQEKLCKDSFDAICDQHNIQYVWGPNMEEMHLNPDESFSYAATIETYPKISHVNWENASLEKIETDITPEAVAQSSALFKKLDIEAIMKSENAMHWCEWIVDVFQHQKLREQVMNILREQNQVNQLPERFIEARSHQRKQEEKEKDEAQIKETIRQYITADTLFKAYALEHNITVEKGTLLDKIAKAKQNPFIMSTVQDEAQLPYYLGPRVFEEAIIQHLSKQANCHTTVLPLSAFIALAFNVPEVREAEVSSAAGEDIPIPTTVEEK